MGQDRLQPTPDQLYLREPNNMHLGGALRGNERLRVYENRYMGPSNGRTRLSVIQNLSLYYDGLVRNGYSGTVQASTILYQEEIVRERENRKKEAKERGEDVAVVDYSVMDADITILLSIVNEFAEDHPDFPWSSDNMTRRKRILESVRERLGQSYSAANKLYTYNEQDLSRRRRLNTEETTD